MEGEPHFTADFRNRLRSLLEDSAPGLGRGEVPPDLAYGMLVSSYCQAVTWWFTNGCAADPRQVASWYLELLRS